MLRKFAIVLACAGISAVAARAVLPTVYQNTRGGYYVFNLNGPSAVAVLDDGHFDGPGGADISSMSFGYAVAPLGPGATADFDVLFNFYNGLPIGSDFRSAKSDANKIAGFRIPFRGVSAAAFGLFATTVNVNFSIPTQDFAVEQLMVAPDGVDVNDITDVACPFIASGGNAPTGPTNVTIGSSADMMFTDDSYDGKYDASTAPTFFGDGVHNGSIYLRLVGNRTGQVPEPGTLALLGSIAPLAGLVIRRKRA